VFHVEQASASLKTEVNPLVSTQKITGAKEQEAEA